MDGEALGEPRSIRLRYAGKCRACGRDLQAGMSAVHDRATKTVTCLNCLPDQSMAEESPIDPGRAGASAQREYERRKDKRETRIRAAHPVVGGFLLALSDDPQSTRAWATGALGEERLGRRLDTLVRPGLNVLHDRRIPRTKANIDHLVVGPSGVFVIDAKRYKGRPSYRVEGGILRPRVEKLMVGSRDCSKLVDGVHKQVGLVRAALESNAFGHLPVTGMLCFVEADWPLIGGDFTIGGLHVLWPKKAAERVAAPGVIDVEMADRVHRALAAAFPMA